MKIITLIVASLMFAACNSTGDQQVYESSGTLIPGQAHVAAIPLSDLQMVVFTLVSDRENVRLSVRDPGGKIVSTSDTSQDRAPFGAELGAFSSSVVSISRPQDGIWQVELDATLEAYYGLTIKGQTTTLLEMDLSGDLFFTGAPIEVNAVLKQGNIFLDGGTLIGEIIDEGNILQTISLQSDGHGQYRGQFPPFDEPFRPDLRVTALHGFIQRQVKVPIIIFSQSGRILGVLRDRPIDGDGDGLAEELVIEIWLSIHTAGHYSITAHLETQTGEQIAYAELNSAIRSAMDSASGPFIPAEQMVALSFSGSQIKDRGADGPYQIRLTLYDIQQDGAEVDQLQPSYLTQPYLAQDFE